MKSIMYKGKKYYTFGTNKTLFESPKDIEIHKANIEYYKRNPMGRSFAGYGHIKAYPLCGKCKTYHPKEEKCK